MDKVWNLWHGCNKKSEGCLHCYVFRRDAEFDIDSTFIRKTRSFDLPIRRNRRGGYKIPSGTLMLTCFSSDFFIEEADVWRIEAWQMIRMRRDLHFFIITKRPERIISSLPSDWGSVGYENVTICCTIENQIRSDERLPIFQILPLPHKMIICEPLLESIDFHGQLSSWCEKVIVGGESGPQARPCHYEWILAIREQCLQARVPFYFKQTGANFHKEGIAYQIARSLQLQQAQRAGIDYLP